MRLEQLGQLAQQFVTGRVSAGVVDDLELVQIHVAEHLLPAAALMALQRMGNPALELLAVDQPGQGVVGRLVG